MFDILGTVSNAATILTAVVATSTAIYFWMQRRARAKRLERYLEKVGHEYYDENEGLGPARRIPHLMVNCYMTEAQILETALKNDRIKPWVGVDDEGVESNTVMFSYEPKRKKVAR